MVIFYLAEILIFFIISNSSLEYILLIAINILNCNNCHRNNQVTSRQRHAPIYVASNIRPKGAHVF